MRSRPPNQLFESGFSCLCRPRVVPQGLKPFYFAVFSARAEAVPLTIPVWLMERIALVQVLETQPIMGYGNR